MRGRREVFRQGADEVLIARMARWNELLRMLVVLERQCLTLREEVEHLYERQEVLADLMERKEQIAEVSTS